MSFPLTFFIVNVKLEQDVTLPIAWPYNLLQSNSTAEDFVPKLRLIVSTTVLVPKCQTHHTRPLLHGTLPRALSEVNSVLSDIVLLTASSRVYYARR